MFFIYFAPFAGERAFEVIAAVNLHARLAGPEFQHAPAGRIIDVHRKGWHGLRAKLRVVPVERVTVVIPARADVQLLVGVVDARPERHGFREIERRPRHRAQFA